ncbi:hypothetical protein GQR58_019964 [Nymphon striatum]|nr:hypothetical protein GQR58_019964 [Nymphon striatum]
MRGNAGATVMFDEDMQVTMKKVQLLANKTNKQRIINMLSKLRAQNCQTHHAAGDADLLIVQKAVESAATTDTVLIGDDTDLLILLIYHTNLKSCDMFFKPEPKKNVKKPRVWNMKYVKQQLEPDVSQHIFFMHALLGCDTTSQVQAASTDDVIEAGEKALACPYNGNPGESLNVVRHKRFCQKVASNTSHVQPQSLPPTSAAAKHHSLRVYYQVQQWKENVCLALKIKPLSHLEVEILGNINLWRPFWIFGQVYLIEMCFIGFLAPENVYLALKIKDVRTFPRQDSLRVLICYRGHISGHKTVDRLSVAICPRLTPFFTRNAWTIERM